MKKLLVVLLSLGLIVAFGATASAADVKFGGSYYLVGVYQDNPTLRETGGYSHALFYQRVRLQPVFQIAEGLTFTARMDALEKQWGNTNWKGGTDDLPVTRKLSAGTYDPVRGVQENFEFERGYVTFMTGIGQFQVGYQNVDDWGTDFSDFSNTRPRIAYATKLGPVTLALTYEKVYESDTAGGAGAYTTTTTAYPTYVDADKDTYAVSATYNDKGIEAGLLYKYYAYNNARPSGVKTQLNQISPYVKATFGPVYVEGEVQYWFGKTAAYEAPLTNADVDLSAWGAYLKAKMNAGPVYFGALFAWASGDDGSDSTKSKANPGGCGTNLAPALILMNDALNTWTAGTTPSSPSGVTSSKYNVIIYNGFVGFNPTPKLNVEAALTYADVDKLTVAQSAANYDKNLGVEFDIKATYKIYDNLTYMIGAGYLWAGDYFKAGGTTLVDNDYVLMNQLTLSF